MRQCTKTVAGVFSRLRRVMVQPRRGRLQGGGDAQQLGAKHRRGLRADLGLVGGLRLGPGGAGSVHEVDSGGGEDQAADALVVGVGLAGDQAIALERAEVAAHGGAIEHEFGRELLEAEGAEAAEADEDAELRDA